MGCWTVKLLLDIGNDDVNSKEAFNRTPLLWAAEMGHKTSLKLLLDMGMVDVNVNDAQGQMALSYAAADGMRRLSS